VLPKYPARLQLTDIRIIGISVSALQSFVFLYFTTELLKVLKDTCVCMHGALWGVPQT
jgi:hypothetical protein